MKKKPWYIAFAAGAAVTALALSGCSSANTQNSSGAGKGIVTTNGSEPQHPLIPTNTNETGGGKIVTSLYSGLVYYDAKGAVHNDVAESITTDDAMHFTIKIRPGLTFSDGTPLKASNFVKTWNYGAALDNKQYNSHFFEDIKGFSYDENVPELEGLKVVDDTTFTVELSQPAADFATRLGYTAYYPMPDSAFADMEAFGKNPIGNGPYKLEKFVPGVEATLVKNLAYSGPRTAKNEGINFKFYAQLDAAYSDLQSGVLDLLDTVPDSVFTSYQSDFPNRSVNQAAGIWQGFLIPERLDHFSGEEGKLRRQAISYAVDRKTITEKIFEGTRTPAKDYTSPIIDGWSAEIPGNEVLEYNPEKAKELWAQADAINPWSAGDRFELAYNADGGHQGWVDAVTNSIRNALGINASGLPVPVFKEFRDQISNRTIQSAFRSGWQPDYPGMYNYLGPLYGTGSATNDGDYSNPAFDAAIKAGLATTDQTAAVKEYQKAQEILMEDLPAIPLWYANVNGAWSKNVENVHFGWDSLPVYNEIVKK